MQADSGKFGNSDSPVLRSIQEEVGDDDDFLGRVPDSSWTVPQVPSPPTASGLHWPKDPQYTSDCALFVPDVCFSAGPRASHVHNDSILSKLRRQL